MRAYAIGDIHGQIDMLHDAHARIARDRQSVGDEDSPIIHLGDLTDRGPASRDVLDYMVAGHAAGQPWITLKGNHDHMFHLFLKNPLEADPGLRPDLTWLHPRLGGDTTLESYGITNVANRTPQDLHAEAMEKVPPEHAAFLASLPLTHRAAGAFFVHAGIRPGIPLDRQDPNDLIWIRGEFHNDRQDHGPLIVHGHTPVEAPRHYANRINLDTGAAYGGPLTAAVIEDRKVWILTEDGRDLLPPPRGLAHWLGLRR